MTIFILEELVDGLVFEVLGKFNFAYFKDLANKDVRPASANYAHAWMDNPEEQRIHPEIAYAKQTLPFLGEGSSRIVFAYSGGKALKIAMNKAGLAQNLEELNAYTRQKLDVIPVVYDAAPDGKWIVAEIVKPFTKHDDFKNNFGVDFDTFMRAIGSKGKQRIKDLMDDIKATLNNQYYSQQEKDYAKEQLNDVNKIVRDPRLVKIVQQLNRMVATGSSTGDMHLEHFGTNVNGDFKFYDYGLTDDIQHKYYDHRNKDLTGSEF